ncbi:MAG: ATPase, T2SS/T4P/T4SS family [Syntrophales bacterium]
MSLRDNLPLDALQQVQTAIKNTASYPENHPITGLICSKSYETLSNLLDKQKTLTVCVFGEKLMVDDVPIDGKETTFANFAKDLEQKDIDSITFCHGLSEKEYKIFLNAMIKRPYVLSQEGGVASILQHQRVCNIRLNDVKYGKISEESESGRGKDSYILDCLRGENGNSGDYGYNLVQIIEDDPQRISDLILQVAETQDITINPYNQVGRAKVAVESMNRLSTELIARHGVTRNQFKENMISILSTCDKEMLANMSKTMEIVEGEQDEIIEGLAGEFLYDAIADTCVAEYIEKGKFNLGFVKKLLSSLDERKKLLPYLQRKLKGIETPDGVNNIFELLYKEPEEICEENMSYENQDVPQDVPVKNERKETRDKEMKDEVTRLLSEGKGDQVTEIIKDLSKRLDDTSWKIRKKISENLLDITRVLDDFDKVNENFREISAALIKRLKQEDHVDTYLIASENLRSICSPQNKIGTYFINETLGGRLFETNEITKEQLQKVLMARKKNGKSLQYNLGALNAVDEAVLTQFLAQEYKNCQTVTLSNINCIAEDILNAVPIRYVKRHLVLPFRLDSGCLHAATMNPNDMDIFKDIRFISGHSVVPHLAAEYHLLKAIEKFYKLDLLQPDHKQEINSVQQEINSIQQEEGVEFCEEEGTVTTVDDLKDSDAPVVRLVNMIIKSAINQKASDIHIEPYENELRVRYRIDGTLTTAQSPSIRYANVMASRIKIMSKLDISEKRLPQDGRFKARLNGHSVDFRVSTFPGIFGEKLVLRLLDSSNITLDINNLGLNDNDLTALLTSIYKSKGMVLVTGPTGSGKTTTLYSVLHTLNDGSKNICTAEDPIEYNLKGINQFQMNSKIGLNFARALRTFLRQDPDIIMVGEIRDFETAEIAVKAALTGHLVLSTLHTNSASETITRMLNMGIEPYLITSSLNLVVAQRLMRKICEKCKREVSPTDLQLKLLNNYGFDISGHKVFKGEGCEECYNTGYKGRVAVYETMPLWNEIQELVLKGKSSLRIEQESLKLGLVTLKKHGLNKVIEGITDIDEWMRVVA